TSGTATLTVTGTAGTTLDSTANFATGDVITLTDANGTEVASLEIEADTTIEDLEALYDDVDGASAAFASNTLTVTSDFKLTTASSDATPANFTTDGTDSGFATDSDIDAALSKLKGAQDTLRSQASTFGTNLSIVEGRQDFTNAIINTLEEGAGKLTLADTNEEGANLLALQTQQTLASTSLSLAAQADQNVLRLF
ncbi:MAG: flagellin, partial [Roseibium sp.]